MQHTHAIPFSLQGSDRLQIRGIAIIIAAFKTLVQKSKCELLPLHLTALLLCEESGADHLTVRVIPSEVKAHRKNGLHFD